ncbi:MAG: phosphotransferase [Candidatus Jordarchaeaceae archaeon]
MKVHRISSEDIRKFIINAKNECSISCIPPEAENIKILNLSKMNMTINEVYSFSLLFDVSGQEHKLECILKRYPKNEKNCEKEYEVLKMLKSEKIGVPHVFAKEIDCRSLGAPFILMEKVDGTKLKNYLSNSDETKIKNIIEQFAKALLNLHSIEWKQYKIKFLEVPEDEYSYAERRVFWKKELPDYVNKNGFEWVTNWLKVRARKNPCDRYSLVRRDMNLNNFIVTKEKEIVMLDWEWAEIGDPMIDVGYAYHNIRHAFGIKNIKEKGTKAALYFIKKYAENSKRQFHYPSFKYYSIYAGLREALYLRHVIEQMKRPSFIIKNYGLKYLPLSMYILWHHKRRYKDLEDYLRREVIDYEDAMFRDPGTRLLSIMEIENILEFLEAKPFELILDIGAGSGRVSRKIESKTKSNVICIDIDRNAALSLKARRQSNAKLQVIVADGQHLPFKDSSFDAVICIRTIKYFPNYFLGIAEISRVLKSQGRLIADFSSMFGYETLLRNITPVKSARNTHVFNFYKLRNLLKDYKLIMIKSTPLQKIPHNFWKIPKNIETLKLFVIGEKLLGKITPLVLSRSILTKCIKVNNDY